MEIKLVLSGLNCANCANKIETKVNKINGIENASLNFSTTVLRVEINKEEEKNDIVNEIKSIVKKLEPHVKVIEKSDNKDIKVNKSEYTSNCCTNSHEHESNNEEHDGHTHEFKYLPSLSLNTSGNNKNVVIFWKCENMENIFLDYLNYEYILKTDN